MNEIPALRREQILKWLEENTALSIEQLAERLGISHMTVHRDLDILERSGQVVKVHGGVKRVEANALWTGRGHVCHMCQLPLSDRTAFVIHTRQEQVLEACCPHCGLLLLDQTGDVISALAKDFIYGRMVNCHQAFYLLECDISLCCVPSVLCFASRDDALRFQMGFGGQVMTFSEAQNHLVNNHRSISHHH